jgi:opacity protein-like surface antigen
VGWQKNNAYLQEEDALMKTKIAVLTGCSLLFALSSVAHSSFGPYLSLNGGMATLNDSEAKEPGVVIDFTSDSGMALTGAVGYNFGHVRMEAELAYQHNDIESLDLYESQFTMKNIMASGKTSSVSGLLNGYYDFVNLSSLTPFVTAGIGFTKVEMKDLGMFVNNEFVEMEGTPDGTAIAYQVGGGFSYALSNRLSLDLKYRYFAAIDLELDSVEFDYSSHNFYGGFRTSF